MKLTPDRENGEKRGRGWFGAREKVVARSAAGLKSPKITFFSILGVIRVPNWTFGFYWWGAYGHGWGTKSIPKAAEGGRKKTH